MGLGVGVGSERERGGKGRSKIFGLSNWKNRVATYYDVEGQGGGEIKRLILHLL